MSTEGYNGNSNLKRIGEVIEYTEEETKELLKCIKNPIYFIENYIKIVHVDKGLVPFKMWNFQKGLIKTIHENRHTISKLSRQCGKCLKSLNKLTIRNKKTGEIKQMTIGEFFNQIKV